MANPLVCIFNPITTLIDQIPSQSVFVGASAAGSPVVLNALGVIDPSFLGEGIDATAGELLVAGALVNLYNNGGSRYMQNAYAAAVGIAPSGHAYPVDAVGFVANNTSISNSSLVLFTGTFTYADPNSEFTAANIGREVYLRATPPAGGVTLTAPSGAGQISQSVGNVVGFTPPNFVLISYIASPQPPFSTPGGVATNVQFNRGGGLFGGIPGSTVDGTNGLMVLAPVGTGVGLTVTGDAHTHDIQDWFIFGGGTPVVALDTAGNVVLNAGIKDHTASLGVGGYVLSSTGSQVLWISTSGLATPGGSPTQLQFNSAGVFAGALNSSVSGTGAVVLGNVTDASPVLTTALTVAGSGGIAVSIQDWFSSNESDSVVASMKTSGLLTCQGVTIQNNFSIGGIPSLSVTGGNAGSPDLADFITASGAAPASTKTVWIDYNGNLHLLEALYDHTGSPGSLGQILSSTGTQTTWVTASASAGGSPTQIQYNLGGVLAGIAGSAVTTGGAVTIAPTTGLALTLVGDSATDDILNLQANSTADVLLVDAFGSVTATPTPGALAPALTVWDDGAGVNDIAVFYDIVHGYEVVQIAQPNTASKAAMSVTGDVNGNDILDLHANDTTLIYSVNSFGSVHISPETGDPTFPALTVQGQSNNTAVFYGQSGGTLTVDTNAKLILAPSVGGAATLQVQDDGGGTNDIADFIYEAGPYNVVGIAQPNTGGVAAIYVNGDANGNDIAKFFGNTGVTGYTGNVQSGTNLGVEITKFGAVVVSPTGPVLTYPGASLVVYVDSPVAHVIDAYGTGSHTVPSFFISGTGTTVCQPQQAAADSLYVYGATGSSHSLVLFDNTVTAVVQVDLYGEMSITPNTVATTGNAALKVQGDLFGDDILVTQPQSGGMVFTIDQNGLVDFEGGIDASVVLDAEAMSVDIEQGNSTGLSNPSVTGLAVGTTYNGSANPTANAVISNVMTSSVAVGNTDAISVLHGLDLSAFNIGTATFGSLAGLTTFVKHQGTGTCTTEAGVIVAYGANSQTATITDLYGVWIQSPTLITSISGTVNAALRIDDPTGGTYTNTYAIYVTGGASSFTGLATAIVTKTTTYTASINDHTINCNGTFTLTLPTTGIAVGQEYYIKNIGTGTITVSSSVNIDGALTLSLTTQYQSVTVQWDGTQWWIY